MTANALAASLAHIVAQARASGLTSIDLWSLEELLHTHHHRPDLLRRGDMLVVGLTDD